MKKHYRGNDGKAICGRQVKESAFASDELEFNLYGRERKACIPCEASLMREAEKENWIFVAIVAVAVVTIVVVGGIIAKIGGYSMISLDDSNR